MKCFFSRFHGKYSQLYSIFLCKFLSYQNYITANFSPFLLTFIAIDRYVCIAYSQYHLVLRRNKTQNIFLIGVASFNLIYYLPAALQFTIKQKESIMICSLKDEHYDAILLGMDFLNRVFIPFILMTLSSILLVSTIFKSRLRTSHSKKDFARLKRQFTRDIRLAVTSLLLNFVFIFFNFPIVIADFIEIDHRFYDLALYAFYSYYAMNFFIIFSSNKIIRNETLKYLNLKKKNINQTNFNREMLSIKNQNN
jgi:hypothetical protein